MLLVDVIFLFMMGFGMWAACEQPVNPILSLIVVIGIFLALRQWDKMGGFNAWKPSGIKRFMTNAKRMGL
jgi:hypothetical protein